MNAKEYCYFNNFSIPTKAGEDIIMEGWSTDAVKQLMRYEFIQYS